MNSLYVFISLMFVFSCSKSIIQNPNSPKHFLESPIVKVWGLPSVTGNNPARSCGIYNDTIYIMSNESKHYRVTFYTFDGKEIRFVDIPKGKGPGEVVFNYIFKIRNEKMYFYDSTLKKIAIFDLYGKSIDDILITEDLGYVQGLEYEKNCIYVHDALKSKIITMDMTGKVVRRIPYENGEITREEFFEKPIRFGRILFDDVRSELWIGYMNLPYTLERYDRNMRKTMTITKKISGSYHEAKWMKMNGRIALVGNMMVDTMVAHDGYIYLPFGIGYYYSDKGIETYHCENTIYVFNAQTGKFDYTIWNKNLKNSGYGYMLLGVTDDYVVLMTVYDYEVANKFASKDELERMQGWIFVLKNSIGNKK